MFFVEHPYVSDFLKRTLEKHALPVVRTPVVKDFNLYPGTPLLDEAQACRMIGETPYPSVYTTSENALSWLSRHPECRHLARKVALFKNKFAFRKMTRPLFPNFAFTEVRAEELTTFPFHTFPCPCIIKPSVGFFSMGVYKITHEKEWPQTVASILDDITKIQPLYPAEVVSPQAFIIEQCITGEEFAIDAYYTMAGEPVILGILQHTFSSDQDVSDRVYTTSNALYEQHLDAFTSFVDKIGRLAGVKNFPVHIELRKRPDGALLPIEVNPLRFGGWCSTADLTYLAYGLNPYLAYHHQQRPDWPELLSGKGGKLFSIIVLDNSTGVPAEDIAAFQFDRVLAGFEKPLELREMDYTTYPVFGFLFTETREERQDELEAILHSSLKEFVILK